MTEINELKKEIESMKSELTTHKILISSLLVHFPESTNRVRFMSTFCKISKANGVAQTTDSFLNLGYFTRILIEREKHK